MAKMNENERKVDLKIGSDSVSSFIKKNISIICMLFLLSGPIIDFVTGVMLHIFDISLTLGLVLRILFLFFIFYVTTFIYNKKNNLLYYGIFIIYLLLFILGLALFKDNPNYFREIQNTFRLFYFPLLLISLFSIRKEIKISNISLVITLCLYLILIFIPLALGIGFESYAITKEGTLGFYNSANEISAIIAILTPILFIIFYESKNIIFKLFITFIYFVVILSVGTKTPLLALIISLFVVFIYILYKSIVDKKYHIVTTFTAIIVALSLVVIIVAPRTSFYNNIEVHLNYLKVDNIFDIFKDKELVDHFIFSQRLTFLNNKEKIYDESNTYQKLFGLGYYDNGKELKSIEMDYFDVYYNQGVVGFIIFFVPYIYVLISVLRERNCFSFRQLMLYLSLFLVIVLSLFTGHIITAPSVSLIVCFILLSLTKKDKKELLFTGVNLNIGGIEKSLVNLVNRIDKDKYKVTIILEEKEGELLEKLDKSIEVKEFKVSNNSNKIFRKVVNLIRRCTYSIFNYHTYDFSCCYATYSYSGNKITRLSSLNNSIYIHSDYSYIYPDLEDFRRFFDTRDIYDFKTIFFVSNESRHKFTKIYPGLKDRCLVFNNFINILEIESLSNEKISLTKPRGKTLFVFVGRLDDVSKKLGRAFKLVSSLDKVMFWVVGDGPSKDEYIKEVKKLGIEDKVVFVGSKINPYPYIKRADYLILTSNYEGFPVVYLEGLALKKKLITTIKVSDDVIKTGKNYGEVIPTNDRKMLEQVREILNSKDKKDISLDLEEIQNMRMKKLETIFDGGDF